MTNPVTPDIIDQARRMRAEGAAFTDICRQLGVAVTTLRRRLRREAAGNVPTRPDSPWSPEMDAALTELYLGRRHTMAQIAEAIDPTRQFGLTRNAISGRVSRLGLSLSRRQVSDDQAIAAGIARAKRKARKHKAAHPWKSAAGAPKPPAPVALTVAPTVQPLNLRIFDDGFGGCRWPTGGEGDQTTFCCLPRPGGKAYCAEHGRIAYKPKQPRKQRGFERVVQYLARAA